MKNNIISRLFGRSSAGSESIATMVTKDTSYLQRAMNFCLALLALVMPMLFLTTTFEAREFNKQAFLFLGVVVILGFWVVKIVTTRRVSWVRTPLDYVILGFTLVYLLASALSVDKVSSFLGFYGRFTGSFVSVVTFVILFFLVVNNVRTQRMTHQLMKWLTAGSFIALIFGFFQITQWSAKIYDGIGWHFLPTTLANVIHSSSFNSVGGIWTLAVFAALNLVLAQWHWLTDKRMSLFKNIVLWVVTVTGFATVFLINVFVGWLVLGLSMLLFMFLGMLVSSEERLNPTWFWKPILILVLSVLFIAFSFIPTLPDPRDIVSINVPQEIQLSNSTNFTIIKNALSNKPILGYGPGTTGIAFGDIKPEVLNKTIVWNVNFDKSPSEIGNILIETGLVGLLLFEVLSILFIVYAFNFLRKNTDADARHYAFGFFAIWTTLYITHFVLYFNTTFYFMFWLSLAGFMAVAHWKSSAAQEEHGSLNSSPRANVSWMFASVLVLAVLAVGTYFMVTIYAADVAYASGLKKLNQKNPDFNAVSSNFSRAVKLNPYRDAYWLANGQNLVFMASVEAAKDKPNVQLFSAIVRDLLISGQKAVQVSPAKANNWSVLAQFYTSLRSLTARADVDTPIDTAIINAWNQAIQRDPLNPILYIRLARSYINAAEIIDPKIVGTGTDADNDGLADEKEKQLGSNAQNSDSNSNGVSDGDEVKAGFNPASTGRLSAAQLKSFQKVDQAKLAEAEKALKRADELKANLVDSTIELSRIYERTNRLDEAQKLLADKFKTYADSIELAFELGRVDYNLKKFDEAEKLFNAILKVQSQNANANYSLGLIYLQKGENVKALSQFEKTREITGPNVELEKLINDLKARQAQTQVK